jgi:hypothetical protein
MSVCQSRSLVYRRSSESHAHGQPEWRSSLLWPLPGSDKTLALMYVPRLRSAVCRLGTARWMRRSLTLDAAVRTPRI